MLVVIDIFKQGEEAVYVRGEVIPITGKVNYINSGTVALYSVEGKEKHFLFLYKKGEIFPYIRQKNDLFSGRQLEHRALSTTSILSIKRQSFEKIAYQPEHVRNFVQSLLEIMELQIERIDNLENGQAYIRLVERLNYIASRLGVSHGDKIVIDTPMSHSDLATSIGTTRETVNRFMKRLDKMGVIKVRKQTIVINSLAALKDIADEPPRSKSALQRLAVATGLVAVLLEDYLSALPI